MLLGWLQDGAITVLDDAEDSFSEELSGAVALDALRHVVVDATLARHVLLVQVAAATDTVDVLGAGTTTVTVGRAAPLGDATPERVTAEEITLVA